MLNVKSLPFICYAHNTIVKNYLTVGRSWTIKLVSCIKIILINTWLVVQVGRSVGETFTIASRVRHGNALSSTLFNIVIHESVKKNIRSGSIIYRMWHIYGYGAYIRNIISMLPQGRLFEGSPAIHYDHSRYHCNCSHIN